MAYWYIASLLPILHPINEPATSPFLGKHEANNTRTSYLVTCLFTFITAAVIAETCSALPSAGSIYLWAAEAGGPRHGRLLGFIVAWWSTTAWTTFCASNTQGATNYLLSELVVFNSSFPTSTSSPKFRAVQWICTEVLLALAALLNFMPRKLGSFRDCLSFSLT